MEIEQRVVGRMIVFSYLVSCPETKEALIIDPAGNEEDLARNIEKKGLNLKYIVNTHGHSDHTCGNPKMKELTGALTLMHKTDNEILLTPHVQETFKKMGFDPVPAVDKTVEEGDYVKVGSLSLKVIHTPGHTPGGMCLFAEGNVFTGDTLFVGSIGRVDIPYASPQQMMVSLRDRLMTLPDETIVWPGHDYGPAPSSTIGLEKKLNPFLRPPYMQF
ncbi:MAG: MBL fold metallo-hydrolase [bacterium]|nr:MBL fold metallo-hydrolase [bacterium]